MLSKTIAKIFAFVIPVTVGCLLSTSCSSVFPTAGQNAPASKKDSRYGVPVVNGKIEANEIRESSGLAASKCQPDVFWTHNDSGDEAFIFAINSKGKKLGTWKVASAKNQDWEDIATIKSSSGECVIFVGDLGNNTRGRNEFTIYRFTEPSVSAGDETSTKKKPRLTDGADAIRITYPDGGRDSETLMVHPTTGEIYIVSKIFSGSAGVYKLKSDYSVNNVNRLKLVAELSVPAIPNGFFTGGDISPDGKRVVVCDYFNAYELILPDGATDFDVIWKEKPVVVELGKREQGEAVGYSSDGNAIYATSEKRSSPMIKVSRKGTD